MTNQEWLDLRIGDLIFIPPREYLNKCSRHPLNLIVTGRGRFSAPTPERFGSNGSAGIDVFLEAIVDNGTPAVEVRSIDRIRLCPCECELRKERGHWVQQWLQR